jgi:hypothetical protein
MKWILVVLLLAFLAYLVSEEIGGGKAPSLMSRKRLCDYYAAGSVFEDIPTALKKGIRLIELHIYSDERDQPVVATQPQNNGQDFAQQNISFEQCCIDIVNDAFPSKDPLILSIVPHTHKTIVWDRVAEHLTSILRSKLIVGTQIQGIPIDKLADSVVIVSGGPIQGTRFEHLVNLSWSSSGVRRLSYNEALHPRDPEELKRFNRDFISIVSPDPEFKKLMVNPNMPLAYGCQWNFFLKNSTGFVEKPEGLQ